MKSSLSEIECLFKPAFSQVLGGAHKLATLTVLQTVDITGRVQYSNYSTLSIAYVEFIYFYYLFAHRRPIQ